MSTALATKLFVARDATVAAYNQAKEDEELRDVLEMLEAAIFRIDEADRTRQQAKK